MAGNGDTTSSDLSEAFHIAKVGGVNCIILDFGSLPEDTRAADKIKTARRKAKDIIGSKHKDMFMLDQKSTSDGHEFCDIIILTDTLKEWDSAMCSYYEDKGYTIQQKNTPMDINRTLAY